MRKFSFFVLFLFLAATVANQVSAQTANPVKWQFEAKKKSDNVYEIVMTAALDNPWHIYSQSTPSGGPVPTKITFKLNPLVSANGKPREEGDLKTIHDPVFGVDVKYFAGKVSFIQTVKLKSKVKTNIGGTVEYMICNDTKCLPPTKQAFDITLQ